MRYGVDTISAIFIAVTLMFIFGRWYESKALFYPDKDFTILPKDIGLTAEDIFLEVGTDKEKIHGWFFNSANSNGKTILYIHGNAGNISDRLPVIKGYLEHRFAVFIFDFRGYGKSEGNPTKDGIVEDSLAAYDFMINKKGVGPENIIIIGQSLGGAPALKLANMRESAGVIMEGCFYSIKEIAKDIFSPLPIWILASSALNNGLEIKKLKVPLLLIHGKNDNVINYRHSLKLFEEANEPKKFVTFENAGHVDMYESDPSLYYGSIIDFAGITEGGK